jgi:hypothetical protein
MEGLGRLATARYDVPGVAVEFGAADEFGEFRSGDDLVGMESVADPIGAQLELFGGLLGKQQDRVGERLSLSRGEQQAIVVEIGVVGEDRLPLFPVDNDAGIEVSEPAPAAPRHER